MKRVALITTLLFVAACGGGGGDPVKPPELASIQVSLNSTTVLAGGNVQATAVGLDNSGAVMSTGGVTWGTSATSIATVNAAGLVTGVSAGQATITASARGKTGQAVLTVAGGWIPTVSGTFVATSLEGEVLSNRFGNVALPELDVICSVPDNLFLLGATVPNIVTNNGSVAYSGTNIPTTSATWLETTSFHTLVHPGPNAATKTLVNQIATGTSFAVGFGEFNGGAKVMTFNVTGMSAAIIPVLLACPGASLASPEQAAKIMERVLVERVAKFPDLSRGGLDR